MLRFVPKFCRLFFAVHIRALKMTMCGDLVNGIRFQAIWLNSAILGGGQYLVLFQVATS